MKCVKYDIEVARKLQSAMPVAQTLPELPSSFGQTSEEAVVYDPNPSSEVPAT
jgi:hypothetical protein